MKRNILTITGEKLLNSYIYTQKKNNNILRTQSQKSLEIFLKKT